MMLFDACSSMDGMSGISMEAAASGPASNPRAVNSNVMLTVTDSPKSAVWSRISGTTLSSAAGLPI